MAAKALNKNNSAVKRIMQEARELANDPCTDYHAAPLEDDIFEWHCTLRGSPGTEFEGGLYHFRILLPAEYPFRPPSIMMLTPSGRFELNTKICISFTSYHEELWQPAWGVRTAIVGLQGFFPLKGQLAAGVGSIEAHASERKRLAALSRNWVCPTCKASNKEILPDPALSSSPNPASSAAVPTRSESTSTPTPVSDSEALVSERGEPLPPGTAASETEKQDTEQGLSIEPDRPTLPSAAASARTGTPSNATPMPTVAAGRRSREHPPLLLDTAILVLLAIVFVIICRRISY